MPDLKAENDENLVQVKSLKKFGDFVNTKLEDISSNIKGISDAPSDGEAYIRTDETWVSVDRLNTFSTTGLEDAPNDGKVYVRTENTWQSVNPQTEIVVTGLEEAPNDGNIYLRQNGSWVKVDDDAITA